MKRIHIPIVSVVALCLLSSCGRDLPELNIPGQYVFNRDGTSTVNYSGQTARIRMSEELNTVMSDPSTSSSLLFSMYDNQGPNGEDVNPFSESELNSETKSISAKVAASQDFFATNSVDASFVKQYFRNWISNIVEDVYAHRDQLAAPGTAGQIADGTSTRYVSKNGLEYNQVFAKSLIGALMLDQIVNNYLSPTVLDAGENVSNNDSKTLEGNQNYTSMEHKWDEAYGYLFGNASDPADPLSTLGSDDSFLNKYLGRVAGDPDFNMLAEDIYLAFRTGRAAITQQDYPTRDSQADLLKDHLSSIIGIRAVYYLEQGRLASEAGQLGAALHALSEGYGFIYSLQFTRKGGSSDSYFTAEEVATMLADLMNDGPDGLWTVSSSTLSSIAETIASKFDFTVAQAAD